jgi:hypothetical protein
MRRARAVVSPGRAGAKGQHPRARPANGDWQRRQQVADDHAGWRTRRGEEEVRVLSSPKCAPDAGPEHGALRRLMPPLRPPISGKGNEALSRCECGVLPDICGEFGALDSAWARRWAPSSGLAICKRQRVAADGRRCLSASKPDRGRRSRRRGLRQQVPDTHGQASSPVRRTLVGSSAGRNRYKWDRCGMGVFRVAGRGAGGY